MPNSNSERPGYQKASTGTASFTNADFAYVRKKRSGGRAHQLDEEAGELNIVPYLDIMVNLIMFLLVAQATMVALGLIDVTAPSYSVAGPGGATDPEKQPLRLTIGIAAEGFFIAAKGGVLPGEESETPEITADGVTKAPPTIPKKADGSYDFPALTAKLRGIKTAFPDNSAVYVAADDSIPYEVIVKALDASREDSSGGLFPQVAFTQIN